MTAITDAEATRRANASMAEKHATQIAMHEASFGAKLGVIKKGPSRKQLDAAYEDRRSNGQLLSQQKR